MTKIVDQIITKRLLLRGIDETDTEKIVLWRSDPDVYKFFKSPHAITAEEHIAWYSNTYCHDPNRYDWLSIERNTGARIGVFGLVKGKSSAEVNYILSPEAQHKGYASEAIEALIDYAHSKWTIISVKAEIHRDNSPSISLVSRLGFQKKESDGDFDIFIKDLEE